MAGQQYSKMDEGDWSYPQREPYRKSSFKTRDGKHQIAWQEYGNPDGEPVIVVHGGPGAGCAPIYMRYFNPDRYRIILFDQRGCGDSKPHVADDPKAGLTNNTTKHLIEDIEELRNQCGIKGKAHIFGGSWGSTLGLAYAITHPEHTQSLILRGIFLAGRRCLNYFYQGNAATYAQNPKGTKEEGTYRTYCDNPNLAGVIPLEHRKPGMAEAYAKAWKDYVEIIPEKDRHDMVAAYARIFAKQEPMGDTERAHQLEALKRWSLWENTTSYLYQDVSDLGKFGEPKFQKAFAMIENHYFMNGCFMGGKSGADNRDNTWILNNLHRIKNIPTYIVHGRYDQVATISDAYALVDGLRAVGNHPEFVTTTAGHSMLERDTAKQLQKFMDDMPAMSKDPSTKLSGSARVTSAVTGRLALSGPSYPSR